MNILGRICYLHVWHRRKPRAKQKVQIKGTRTAQEKWVLPNGNSEGSTFLWNVGTSVTNVWLCNPVDHTLYTVIRTLNPISFSLHSVELLHIILATNILFRLTWCCFCCLACAIAVWSNRSHDFCLLLVGVPAPLVCCCGCWVLCPLLSSLRGEGLAVGMTFIAGGILVAEAGGCNKHMANKIAKDLFHHNVQTQFQTTCFEGY